MNIFKLVSGLLFLTAMILLQGCALPREQVAKQLYQAFDDLVFNYAPDITANARIQRFDHLIKWRQPIYYEIIGDRGSWPAGDEPISEMMAEFSRLTGVQVRAAENPDKPANFSIVLADERGFNIQGSRWVACYARRHNFDDYSTKNASIHMAMQIPDMAFICIKHEMMHGFGFSGHTNAVLSTMNSSGDSGELTQWDKILLRILYHPDLRPGMTKDEAMPVVKLALDDLLKKELGN